LTVEIRDGVNSGLLNGLYLGLVAALVVGLRDKIHDNIARTQHFRRQRLLQAQEQQGVPDTALSRVKPPGEPTPTDAALSLADTPEEKARLAASTDTSAEEEVPVKE